MENNRTPLALDWALSIAIGTLGGWIVTNVTLDIYVKAAIVAALATGIAILLLSGVIGNSDEN